MSKFFPSFLPSIPFVRTFGLHVNMLTPFATELPISPVYSSTGSGMFRVNSPPHVAWPQILTVPVAYDFHKSKNNSNNLS